MLRDEPKDDPSLATDTAVEAPAEESLGRVFTVPVEALDAVRGALNNLSKRAAKTSAKAARLGLSLEGYVPISMTVGEPFVTEGLVGRHPTVRRYLAVHVTLTGQAPKLGGWHLRATLQHEEAGVVVRALPGTPEGLLAGYRHAATLCDHCATGRRRKDTYIVQHTDDGTLKQVGSSCLADFTQTKTAANAVGLALLFREAEEVLEASEGGGSFMSASVVYSIQEFLTMAVLFIEENGWVSRAAARDSNRPSTAAQAFAELSKRDPKTPSQAHHAQACAALSYMREKLQGLTSLSDYEHNLLVALTPDHISHRSAGLVASVLPAYDRERGLAIQRLLARPVMPGHFGQPGTKGTWELHLVKVSSFDSEYGAVFLHTFHDPEGHVAVWKTTSTKCDPGLYTVTATVKAHDVYRGQDQTVLTRAKLISVTPASSP